MKRRGLSSIKTNVDVLKTYLTTGKLPRLPE